MIILWLVVFLVSSASVAYGVNELTGYWSYHYIIVGLFNLSFGMIKAVENGVRHE